MGIVLVTGTSSGIGLATAVTLARAGHQVIATMRNPASADDLQKVVKAEKLSIDVSQLDVNVDASVERAVAQVLAEHKKIDVLVNNAGLGGGGAIEELPMAVFREVMETNYFGALRCIKAVLPSMRERRHGHIINVTSIAGRIALAPQAAYAASKWALEALSECLAQEMNAFNVRVSIIEPGVIATPIFGKAKPIPKDSPYPHARRQRAMYSVSLGHPTSAYVVGEQIKQIIDSIGLKLRYPVGPDAIPFLNWRASKTDEELIEFGGATDEQYKMFVKREFGLDVSI